MSKLREPQEIIPQDEYEVKVLQFNSTSFGTTVVLEITSGAYRGRKLFAPASLLVPKRMRVVVGHETFHKKKFVKVRKQT